MLFFPNLSFSTLHEYTRRIMLSLILAVISILIYQENVATFLLGSMLHASQVVTLTSNKEKDTKSFLLTEEYQLISGSFLALSSTTAYVVSAVNNKKTWSIFAIYEIMLKRNQQSATFHMDRFDRKIHLLTSCELAFSQLTRWHSPLSSSTPREVYVTKMPLLYSFSKPKRESVHTSWPCKHQLLEGKR